MTESRAHTKNADEDEDSEEVPQKKIKTREKDVDFWFKFVKVNTCFKSRIITLSYQNADNNNILLETFLSQLRQNLPKVLQYYLKDFKAIKYNFLLFAEYSKIHKDDDKPQSEEKNFQTKMQILTNFNDWAKQFSDKEEELKTKSQNFEERDSGWSLVALNRVEININKYQPLKGSSHIPLPREISNRKCCINVKNKDQYCFKWALLSATAKLKNNLHDTKRYKRWNIEAEKLVIKKDLILDFTNLKFPLKLEDIATFERRNNKISINVFGYEAENKLINGPLYKTNFVDRLIHINLLYLENDNSTESHYVWIKNSSR